MFISATDRVRAFFARESVLSQAVVLEKVAWVLCNSLKQMSAFESDYLRPG